MVPVAQVPPMRTPCLAARLVHALSCDFREWRSWCALVSQALRSHATTAEACRPSVRASIADAGMDGFCVAAGPPPSSVHAGDAHGLLTRVMDVPRCSRAAGWVVAGALVGPWRGGGRVGGRGSWPTGHGASAVHADGRGVERWVRGEMGDAQRQGVGASADAAHRARRGTAAPAEGAGKFMAGLHRARVARVHH